MKPEAFAHASSVQEKRVILFIFSKFECTGWGQKSRPGHAP